MRYCLATLHLCLLAGCGAAINPFAPKDSEKPLSKPDVEILTELTSSGDVTAVLVETNETTSELGAFLTGGEGNQQNLQLVDVQKPGTPFEVGQSIKGQVRKAVIHDNMLIVLDGANALTIYSLSDRANPVKMASVELPLAREIIYDFTFVAETRRIYFSTELSGLQTAKIDKGSSLWPSQKVMLPKTLTGPFNFLVAINGNLAISDLRSENLFFLQLTDDLNTEVMSTYNSGGRIFRLRTHKDQLFICDVETGLHKLDLKDLANPKLLYNLNPDGITRDVIELENHLVLASDGSGRELGMTIYRKQPDGNLIEDRKWPTPGILTSLQKVGDLVYAVDNLEGKSTLLILRLNL